MKKLWAYYIVNFVPIIAFFALRYFHEISKNLFVDLLMFYVLLYYPTISGLRLIALGIIRKGRFYLNYIPFWTSQYLKSLLFRAH